MDLSIIQKKIFEIRGQRVMLDKHLAELYGVETKVLVQGMKRNINRFPSDFMFQLNQIEPPQLEVTICDLKLGRFAVFALCIYRTWHYDAV